MDDITKNKLLEEARKRFPKGTEFIGGKYNEKRISHPVNFRWFENDGIFEGRDYVYYKGKWVNPLLKEYYDIY